MENTEVMQSKQYDPAEGMPGSTVKIREVMEKIESVKKWSSYLMAGMPRVKAELSAG